MSILTVYVTYPDMSCAQSVSEALVTERLAACANILPVLQSLYWWEGAVQKGTEIGVIYKTTTDRFDALRDEILSLHPYECPCIVALPIERGHGPYLQWVENETKK